MGEDLGVGKEGVGFVGVRGAGAPRPKDEREGPSCKYQNDAPNDTKTIPK